MKHIFSTFFFLYFILTLPGFSASAPAEEDCTASLSIGEIIPNTRCSSPNGTLEAMVADADGNEYSGTLTYAWYPEGEVDNPDSEVGNDKIAEGLSGGTYVVVVTEPDTQCRYTASATVPEETAVVEITLEVLQHQTSCREPGSGIIEANVESPNGSSNIGINWYRGPGVDETMALPMHRNALQAEELSAGLYTVQAIDNNTGCASTPVSVQVQEQIVYPVVAGTIFPNTACDAEQANGSISLEISMPEGEEEPAGGYEVAWFAGSSTEGTALEATGATVEGLAAGTYIAVVSNSESGCSVERSFLVAENVSIPELAATAEPNTVCDPEQASVGAYTGAISLELMQDGNIVTDPADYLISWYRLEGEETLLEENAALSMEELPAGAYKIVATHQASGCSSEELVVNIENATEIPAIVVSSTNITHCDTPNGSVSATVEGNAGNIILEWYSGEQADAANLIATVGNGEELSGLAAGSYTVIAIDQQSGCASAAETITLTDETSLPQVEIGAVQHVTSCEAPNGSAAAYVLVDGQELTEGYTFNWYTGSEVKEEPDYTGVSITDLSEGIYSVEAIHNASGCVSTVETVEIKDLTASPEVEATLTHNTACDENLADGSIILSISTPLPGADPEGGYQVEWFLGAGSDGTPFEATGIILEGLAAGSYTAVVTNPESGCSSQHTFTIEDDLRVPALSLASVEPNTVCDPSLAAGNAYTGAISLELMQKGEAVTEPSDYTISWYVLEGETETLLEENTALSREGLPAGRYKVVAVNQLSGCSSEELIIEVEEATQTPVVEAVNVQPLTHCDTPNGEIEIALEGNGEAGEYRVEWYQGNEVDADLRLEDLSDQYIVSGLAAGSYTVQGTHMETGCPSAPLTLVIEDATAAPLVTVESTPLTNCNPNRPDGAFSFNVDGETSGYSFVLYRGSEPDEAALVGEGSEIQGLREGQYLLVATDETTSCVSSSLVSIETGISFPEPPITIGAESCEAAELTLRVEGEGTYYWYTQPTGGNAFHAGNSLFRNFNQTTTYYVTAVNEDGCESRERSPVNALIHELEEPAIEANDNILSTTLDDSFSYQWYLDGELLAEETEHMITAETSGTYEVEVTNEAGCSRRSAPYEFTVSAVINKEYDAAIRVYPNPFQNQLHISLARGAGATNIRIMDSQMRQLRSLTITAKEELTILDLSALPQGIYYLEVREGDKVTYKRIARQ